MVIHLKLVELTVVVDDIEENARDQLDPDGKVFEAMGRAAQTAPHVHPLEVQTNKWAKKSHFIKGRFFWYILDYNC